MVPKQHQQTKLRRVSFRAVLFRMVPKLLIVPVEQYTCFRAVLFRMVPKHVTTRTYIRDSFRAVLFRMVPKQ